MNHAAAGKYSGVRAMTTRQHPPQDSDPPLIGIMMLDTEFPRIPGDVGNPGTFSFPVRYETVSGASAERVVRRADPLLLPPFLEAARKLEALGVKALATSCGFLALFHQELVRAVNIPVFSSSLLQVYQARAVIQPGQEVGIIAADSRRLTPRHFAGLGLCPPPKAVVGLEESKEFSAVFFNNKLRLDREKLEQEVVAAARQLIQRHPRVGAVVLECTNLPPYAGAVQKVCGLPVFDVVTLINYAYLVVHNDF
ncbi:MAG: aspartate/glutamate racemase family protein [Desulfohalobiaceae bacterium]|nr:aspartate/glutamate racemase family protein [Desulfohalobiaceae bacterium]